MLQAHSLLWDYLWVGPNALLLALGFTLWRRGTWRAFPAFLAFAVFSAAGQIAVFAADVVPSVSPENFWRVDWVSLLIESFLKFFVIGEIFARVLKPYPSISKLGRILVSGLGAVLVLVAALTAAYSRGDSAVRLISGAHILEQTAFMIASGLILFLFLFAAYFQLSWDRPSFGILLGLGISACVHLATWAILANAAPSPRVRTLFAFLIMAVYHACVLIWVYYLLIPEKKRSSVQPIAPAKGSLGDPLTTGATHEETLDLWNRELGRLVNQ
jgi:hypothetical protein